MPATARKPKSKQVGMTTGGAKRKRRMSSPDRRKTRSLAYRAKFKRVMQEFARGELRSGRGRALVKDRKQAQAIAHSEAMKAAGGKARK